MKYEFSYSTYFQYLSEQIRRIAPDMEKTALKDEQLVSLKDRINKIDKLASTKQKTHPNQPIKKTSKHISYGRTSPLVSINLHQLAGGDPTSEPNK